MLAYLVIREGSKWTDVFRLVPGRTVTVGRAGTNQIVIKDERCSRNHIEVFLNRGEWTLRDLESRNGTFINGIRAVGEQPLSHGAMLKIGKLEFEVLIEEPVAPKAGASEPGSSLNAEESWADDNDITKWLEEGGASASQDPETRQFRLDETERAALETTVDQVNIQTTVSTDSKSGPQAAKREKKKPRPA